MMKYLAASYEPPLTPTLSPRGEGVNVTAAKSRGIILMDHHANRRIDYAGILLRYLYDPVKKAQ